MIFVRLILDLSKISEWWNENKIKPTLASNKYSYQYGFTLTFFQNISKNKLACCRKLQIYGVLETKTLSSRFLRCLEPRSLPSLSTRIEMQASLISLKQKNLALSCKAFLLSEAGRIVLWTSCRWMY